MNLPKNDVKSEDTGYFASPKAKTAVHHALFVLMIPPCG
jgi:hypothetical protein